MKLEGDRVVSRMGDVLAEKINGVWETKNPEVLAFLAEQEEKPKPKAKKKAAPKKTEEKLEMVRARDENGHFIADDPETEVNEAWVVKTAKKVLKKK
jgi:hypothetical protein